MREPAPRKETNVARVIDRQVLITGLWFLRVRWLAMAAVLLGGIGAALVGYHLSLIGIFAVAGYLLLANIGFFRFSRRLRRDPSSRRDLALFVNLQILSDWLAVLALVYLTGGVSSPCSLFFVFHILMASILLPVRQVLVQASVAMGLVSLLFLADALQWIGHRSLIEGVLDQAHREPRYIVAVLGILALTIYASIALGNWVGNLLRRRMAQLSNTKNRLEEANQRMQAIFEVMRLEAANRDIDSLLSNHAEQATRLWEIQAAFIILIDPKTGEAVLTATHGLDERTRPDEVVSEWSARLDRFLRSRETIFKDTLSRSAASDDDPVLKWLAGQKLESLMVVPLKVGHSAIGGFCLASRQPGRFTREDAKYFKIFADLASIQIELVRANTTLMTHSETSAWFFNRAAHDLRAPLAAVRSLMSLITDGFTNDLEQIQNLVSRASKRLEGLSGMVNDLLLVAQDRFEALEPKLEAVNLLVALESTVQLHEAEAISKDIGVNLDADPEPTAVKATLDSIERVFSNLLSNAIKYTPRGGRITMTLRDVDHRYLLFRISDTGIGIPKEAQAHIFEEFYRAPNAKKLNEIGTGLGLTITRRFIEHFGGRLVFESEEGKGTTFSFFLPTVTTPARATPAILRELGWAG